MPPAYRRPYAATMPSRLNCSRTRASEACASRRRNSASLTSRANASASAPACWAGTNSPLDSGSMSSGLPPTAVATGAHPQAMASSSVLLMPSAWEGSAKMSTWGSNCATSLRSPGSQACSAAPASARRCLADASSAPAPSMTRRKRGHSAGHCSRRRRNASTRFSGSFTACIRPTAPMTRCSPRRNGQSGGTVEAGLKRSVSTPLQIRCTRSAGKPTGPVRYASMACESATNRCVPMP
mmetsp:Transcript_62789/g.154410  ORF Transcript_62789/g.154410 Transcript_62789/m.154410 type:complete len:239 (+) Transcript_62789:543-1259(+)